MPDDLNLQGGGVLNFATTSTPDNINNFSTAPTYLHDLFCSGFNYALIDISSVWCGSCQDEAAHLPSLYQSWLNAGGIVFSILVQSDNPAVVASEQDLATWISTYSTPYPMVLDGTQDSVRYFTGSGYPFNLIIDLSSMKVLYPGQGNDPVYFQTFCEVLGVTDCFDGGS